MGKRGVFAVIALVISLSISFSLIVFAQSEESSVKVDHFVESALTVAPEVNVIIVLKEPEIDVSKDAPDITLEKTKDAVEEVKDEFIDNLPEETKGMGVSDASISNIQTYETINVVAATITEEGLEELKNNPAVEQIILEPVFYTSLIDSVPLINANDVHNLSISGARLNGTGTIACVLDSGIELNHSAFTGRLLPGYDFINNDSSPDDDMANSHGTHVSGTIAGLTINGTGVAPAAQLIPVKVCNSTGGCSASAMLSGIDFCNNLTSTYNISVISMSISDGGQYTSGTCPTYFDSGFSTSLSLGIIPVMASGNNGYTGGISYPACSPHTISVGSTTKADAMSSFTNRGGDTLDILAPGSSIISTIRGNTVGVLSGTSMATPHVSGLVLLMQQNEILNGRSPLNISQIRSVLQQTSVPVSGYQRIDAYNAITKLNYNYTINNSGRKVSYQSGSQGSEVTFDTSTDFSNFAECSSLGSNFVYVNSASCPQFNKSASIKFEGITASNVSPTRDGAPCGSYCSNINFSGGILTFNVSSFSNYSYEVSNSSNGSNYSIMNISSHYNLTGDYNGSVHLLADNIIFDCAGFVINAGSEPAIRSDGRTNVTIRNCSITGTTDILFNGTNASMVVSTQGNGSLVFIDSDDNLLEDLTLRSSGLWISTDSQSNYNEFINLTFTNGLTSVHYSNVTAPSGTNVNQSNFILNSGSVRVNGTQLSWLNTEAQITMNSLNLKNSSSFNPPAKFSQIPVIDLNDTGNFVPCPSSICNQTEFYVDRLVFTTQHFTTINSTSSFPVLINDSSTLEENISVNGSAIIMNGDGITLDCQSFSMTGNGSGTGISSTDRKINIIKNCQILKFNKNIRLLSNTKNQITNITTINATQENIEIESSNETQLTDIFAQGNSDFASIELKGGQNNNLTNIISSSSSTAGFGAITLDTQSLNNILTNITVNGTNSGIGILIYQQSNNNTLTNITATTDGNAAVYIENSNLTSIIGGNLTGNSQPGLYLNIVQNLTLSNLAISSSSGFGADLGNVQNSTLNNINFTSISNEALRTSAINRNNFTNIRASASSNPAIRVTGSNNLFTNVTANTTSGIPLLIISSASHNRFIGFNATSSSGAGVHVSLNSNNNSFENGSFTTNTNIAINLVSGVQNNTFKNVNISTNSIWIHSDADSPNNTFENSTFKSNFGSIKTFAFSMNNGSRVGTNNLSITENKAFLNSSLLPFLNVSSQITLNDAVSKVMIFDLEDDGQFSVCSPPRCALQTFNGSQIVFNVTSFTSYSTSQGGVNITFTKTDSTDPVGSGQQLNYTILFNVTNGTAFNVTINETYSSNVTFHSASPTPSSGNNNWNVGNLTAGEYYQINITVNVSANTTKPILNRVNATYENSSGSQFTVNVNESTIVTLAFPLTITTDFTLDQNASANGSAIIIGADNITLDCAGFTLTGNGSGTGVNATGRNNITIRNCVIVNFNQDILLSSTNNSFVANNTLFNASLENIEFINSKNNLASILRGFANSTGRPFFNISGGSNNTLTNMYFNATFQGVAMNSGTHNNTVANSTLMIASGGIVLAIFDDNNTFFNVTAASLSGFGSGMHIQGGSGNIISFSNISSAFVGMSISLNGDDNIISNSVISGTVVGLQLSGLSPGFSALNNVINNSRLESSSGQALQFGFNVSNNFVANSNFSGSSTGAVLFSQAASSNTVESSIINGAGVRFETNSSNNTLSNVTINETSVWIFSDGNVNVDNTLRNVSFTKSSGTIKTFLSTLPNSTSVDTSNLDITQNRAFLNSSANSFLNVSSQIILNNVSSGVPYVDFNDDNIFDVCSPPQCVVESFNGSTAVFNVSSFTSYSTASSGNVTVTLSKTDSTDPVGPGDIFTYQINYNVTNGSSFNTIIQENYPSQLVFINATPAANVSNNIWFAQNLTENSTFQINITVQANSSVLSTTTINNTVNVSYENSTGSLFNINVTQNTTILVAFPVNISTNTTLVSNITTNGSAFVMNTSNVTFDCNGFTISGAGSGVAFNITGSNSVSIKNCRIQNFTSDILLFNSTFANLTNNTLVTPNIWLSADSTSNASLTDITFQNGQGSLLLLTPVVMPSSSNVNNVKLNVSLNRAFLNSTNLSFLNTSFRVRLDNLNVTTPDILADYDDNNIFQLCTVCSFVSYNGSTLIFDVAHFTTYTSVESGVNFTITKTASPDPVTPGSQVTYTITFTVNSGFAQNITVVENPPAELTFVSSTPSNISANTWVLQNLSTGQSAQINATYNVSSNFTGTINNSINVSFQNSTNGTITTQVNSTSTASAGGGGSSSGGGGGGSSSVICPPLCSDPLNKNLAICRNNCPLPTEQVAAPITFPELPITKESSSSEQVQEKESVETQEAVEEAPPVVEEIKISNEETKKNSIVSSPAFKFGLPLVLGIALLIFILSRLPRHPKDKFANDLKKNEQRIKEIELQLRK